MEEVFLFILLVGLCTGEIIVQSPQYCSICTTNEEFCRNPPYEKTRYKFLNREEEEVSSNLGDTYSDGRNCIVSIQARPNHQIEVQVSVLAVDVNAELDPAGYPIKCYDYVKLFNGPTADNARMFPFIPASGICGLWRSESDMTNLRTFRTTQNHLTIQFITDSRKESYGGFRLRIKQMAYSNTGNLYPTGGNLGGWNDGSMNEFQMYWQQQNVIPGGIYPGTGGKDYGQDKDGIKCYDCENCPVEPFDPEGYGINVRSGCHICSKEWDNSYQTARRVCYSETDYNLVLGSLSYAGDVVTRYTGCKKFVTQYGRTVNYCFCSSDSCNSGWGLHFAPGLVLVCLLSALLASILR